MVNRGDRVGIIGGNGCGKSTLSKLLLGIHRPRLGEATLFGRVTDWTEHFANVSYIGDPGHNAEELGLPTKLTIRQVVTTLSALYGTAAPSAHEMIERLGLRSLFDRKIANLSTGERKRLMVCLAFLKKPELIILDEPFDGLDKHIVVYIDELMQQLLQDRSTTVFLISHSQIEIDTYAERVYRIEGGKLTPVKQQHFDGEITVGENTRGLSGRSGKIMGELIETLKSSAAANGIALRLEAKSVTRE